MSDSASLKPGLVKFVRQGEPFEVGWFPLAQASVAKPGEQWILPTADLKHEAVPDPLKGQREWVVISSRSMADLSNGSQVIVTVLSPNDRSERENQEAARDRERQGHSLWQWP